MTILEGIFWASLAVFAYTYAGYPLAVAALARLRERPVRRGHDGPRTVSIVMAARDEEATIGRRVDELARLIEGAGLEGEVIVVSDGSSDRTARIARERLGRRGRVVDLDAFVGKAAALSLGVEVARSELIAFADARQRWAPDALARLVENFADPEVGAVSGQLLLESEPGVLAGVGLYWRFETWLRSAESRAGSMIGVTGAICAVRRELFEPIPPGTILDDVYWPLHVALRGGRVVFDARARAFDRLPDLARDEFRRKLRTLSGNYQLAARVPRALVPGLNPVWPQLVSHKLLRLIVPWALLAMLATSPWLPGVLAPVMVGLQAAAYALAVLGAFTPLGRRSRLASAAGSFLMLNLAALLAFGVWATGRASRSWTKVRYKAPSEGRPARLRLASGEAGGGE